MRMILLFTGETKTKNEQNSNIRNRKESGDDKQQKNTPININNSFQDEYGMLHPLTTQPPTHTKHTH
jgi:hypothetical protein